MDWILEGLKDNWSAIVAAIGPVVLAISSWSIRMMQAEKRREEKHEIGKLTEKEKDLVLGFVNGRSVLTAKGNEYVHCTTSLYVKEYNFGRRGIKKERNFDMSNIGKGFSTFGYNDALKRLLIYGWMETTRADDINSGLVYQLTPFGYIEFRRLFAQRYESALRPGGMWVFVLIHLGVSGLILKDDSPP